MIKRLILLGGLVLAGCSDATRTVPVLVWDERTISGDIPQDPLVIPSDYRNPKLPAPKEDPVITEYKKNNFLGEVKSAPLPPPRPR